MYMYMLPFIVFLTLCFISTLAADTIGNVEYQLPEEGKHWVIEKQGPSQGIPGQTILYQPEKQSLLGIEFFGAYIKKSATDTKNSEAFKNEIESAYPEDVVSFKVLSTDSQSELVEWSVGKGGIKKLHGWARIFSTPDSTTMLFYQNEKGESAENLEKIRNTWLKTLKEAKIVEPANSISLNKKDNP